MQKELVFAVAVALVHSTLAAQAVRKSQDSFPMAAPTIVLPVAPAAAPEPAGGTQAIGRAALGVAFDITPEDKSVREALARWSQVAGWHHDPSHWTIDKDHPIEGVAGPEVFGTDFKRAVRHLLASTELTDRPVQPCFYTNQVVRVIPKAEFCDKTVE